MSNSKSIHSKVKGCMDIWYGRYFSYSSSRIYLGTRKYSACNLKCPYWIFHLWGWGQLSGHTCIAHEHPLQSAITCCTKRLGTGGWAATYKLREAIQSTYGSFAAVMAVLLRWASSPSLKVTDVAFTVSLPKSPAIRLDTRTCANERHIHW